MNRNIRSRHRQKGLSSFGWIFVVAIFAFLLTTFFKVFPMYYAHFRIGSAMDALKADESLDVKSRQAIWVSLSKRLLIEEIRTIKKEHLKVSRKDGKTTVTVTYEAREDYIANLYIGGIFVKTVVIDR